MIAAVAMVCGGLWSGQVANAPSVAAATGPTAFPFPDPDTVKTSGTDYITFGSTVHNRRYEAGVCGQETSSTSSDYDWNVPYVVHGSGNNLSMNGICPAGPKNAGDLMDTGAGTWADPGSAVWAPSIVAWNDTYYLYYTAKKNGQACIGQARTTTASIKGPYAHQREIACPPNGRWAIDPDVFVQNGYLYMTYRDDYASTNQAPGNTALALVRMNNDGTGNWATHRKLLDSDAVTWDTSWSSANGIYEHILENPSLMLNANGRYYLTFSGNAWSSMNYASGIADCGTSTAGGLCTVLGSTTRPYWGFSDRDGAAPLYAMPGNDLGPGGISQFRTHGGFARVVWHIWFYDPDRWAKAGEFSLSGGVFSIT